MFRYKSLALISKVLFEITLLQEWKKLLAAQILQRTLFKYIAIKNNFFLFAGSVLSAFPVVPTADFSAESGAKISHLFETTKSFRKIFFRNFQNLFSYRFEPYFLFEAGAKVSHFSESPKDFGTFFKIFQNLFFRPGAVFLSRSGCKDKGIPELFPNNSGTFFDNFTTFFTHGYRSAS